MILRVLAFILLSVTYAPYAQAAPAAAAPECLVTGTVQSIEEREHVYEPRSWAESWGLPKSITYIDVSIDVSDVQRQDATMVGECDHTKGLRVFQLDNGVKKPEIGTCIKAVIHVSGDEFRIGNWIKSAEPVASSHCRQAENAE